MSDRERLSLFVDEMRAMRAERGWSRAELAAQAQYSQRSHISGANCVEAGVADHGRVLIRGTANRDGAVLDMPAEAWERFTASLK